MSSKRNTVSYILDLIHGAKSYPCGWLKPKVVEGYFSETDKGKAQKLFFDELSKIGFKRTYWQLVFPNQTAGLIMKIPALSNGVDEYHVRFYEEGMVDCELEVNRFDRWHWAGPRNVGNYLLNDILSKMTHLSEPHRKMIKGLFGTQNYSNKCIRKSANVSDSRD